MRSPRDSCATIAVSATSSAKKKRAPSTDAEKLSELVVVVSSDEDAAAVSTPDAVYGRVLYWGSAPAIRAR